MQIITVILLFGAIIAWIRWIRNTLKIMSFDDLVQERDQLERQLSVVKHNNQHILDQLATSDQKIKNSYNAKYPNSISHEDEYAHARLLLRQSLRPGENLRDFVQREREEFRCRM